MKMKDENLVKLYNDITGANLNSFSSIFDMNHAHITIYERVPIVWEMIFLREVYEELQEELPSIKKKVIAKAIRELKVEYMLSLRIERDMDIYGWNLKKVNNALRCVRIDVMLKKEFKNYIKDAFKHNRVKWHWWNNLEWGL
jgi:hypothetical protein